MEPPAQNNNRMYETMLCSTIFNAENPHCLKAGALNDMNDEDDGGLV